MAVASTPHVAIHVLDAPEPPDCTLVVIGGQVGEGVPKDRLARRAVVARGAMAQLAGLSVPMKLTAPGPGSSMSLPWSW